MASLSGPRRSRRGFLRSHESSTTGKLVVTANADTGAAHAVFVIVDQSLNPAETAFRILYSNKSAPQAPGAVQSRAQGAVTVREVDGSTTNGPLSVLSVTLQPMEVQMLGV